MAIKYPIYGFDEDATHSAIIYVIDSQAYKDTLSGDASVPDTEGLIVGSSEWGWISRDWGRRICAALHYFQHCSTEEIEALAEVCYIRKHDNVIKERHPNQKLIF